MTVNFGRMSGKDMILKMSGNNAGALTFICEILKENLNNIRYLKILYEDLHLEGSALYQFWNDCCQRDNKKVIKVLDKYKKGEITRYYILGCVCRPYGENIEI